MSIKLLLTHEGNLEINALDQNDYSIDDQGTELVLPFATIEKGPHHIIVDTKGNINDVVEYLVAELKKNNINCILDHNLEQYWNTYTIEKEKIKKIGKQIRVEKKSIIDFQKIFKTDRKPLKHQKDAIYHAIKVDNPANFSVPGSGKTQTALGCFAFWKQNKVIEKTIVIGPASCFKPWEDEAKTCLKKEIEILRWSGSSKKRITMTRVIKDADLILVTYQTACNDQAVLEQLMRRYKVLLILDESHNIKNPNGSRSQTLIKLSKLAYRRIILTGTPAPHSLTDLWAQFTFLWPSRELLGNIYEYKDEIENLKNPVMKLKRDLKPFFIRTTKKQLGLPKIKTKVIIIDNKFVPKEQQSIIKLLELRTLYEARKHNITGEELETLRKWRTARIIRLLQAASNPGLIIKKLKNFSIDSFLDVKKDDLVEYAALFLKKERISAKINTVINIAKLLIKQDKKVVIWTGFVDNIKLLMELLAEFKPLPLYGEIKPYENKEVMIEEESRERNILLFKTKSDRPLLLANPAACAESISLHKVCQNAIYLDRNFNCGQFLQSMDRIHRVGMPDGLTATYYIPVLKCAIERAVDSRLKLRQKIMYSFLNDSMQTLGIEDDMWIADSRIELDAAFDDVIKEIKHDKSKKTI